MMNIINGDSMVLLFRIYDAEATFDANGTGLPNKKGFTIGGCGTAGDEVVLLNLAGGTEDALDTD
jgi:hypothetical protein